MHARVTIMLAIFNFYIIQSQNAKDRQSIQRGIELPIDWSIKNDHKSQSLSICKITHLPSTSTAKQPLSLSHCLIISRDLTWKLYVHGHAIGISLGCTDPRIQRRRLTKRLTFSTARNHQSSSYPMCLTL